MRSTVVIAAMCGMLLSLYVRDMGAPGAAPGAAPTGSGDTPPSTMANPPMDDAELGQYKRNFLQLKQWLEEEFPETIGLIDGKNYPAPPTNQLIVSVIGYLQIATVAMLFVGDKVCQALGITKPAALGWAQNNKVTVVIMTFLASSMAGQLTATGAFEISYGDQLVFSKLQEGRLPSLQELRERFEEAGLAPLDALSSADF